jgi:hypothetical protein
MSDVDLSAYRAEHDRMAARIAELERQRDAPPKVEIAACPVVGHDGEHLQFRTNSQWLCWMVLEQMRAAQDLPSPVVAENDRIRREAAEMDGYHAETIKDILLNAGDEFDGDEAADAIAVRYVRHLEARIGEMERECDEELVSYQDGQERLSDDYERLRRLAVRRGDVVREILGGLDEDTYADPANVARWRREADLES